MTLEGAVAQEVLMQGGAWRFSGLGASLTGLDVEAALARVDTGGADPGVVRRLVALAEPGLVAGLARAREQARREKADGA